MTWSNYSEFRKHNDDYSRPESQSLLGATVFEVAALKLVVTKLAIDLWLSSPPRKAIARSDRYTRGRMYTRSLKTTQPNFTKFSVRVTSGRGLVLI